MFYCLSDQILEERDHVRDVYTHRKGFPSPLLVLEFLDQEFAFNKRQAQVHQSSYTYLFESVFSTSISSLWWWKTTAFQQDFTARRLLQTRFSRFKACSYCNLFVSSPSFAWKWKLPHGVSSPLLNAVNVKIRYGNRKWLCCNKFFREFF